MFVTVPGRSLLRFFMQLVLALEVVEVEVMAFGVSSVVTSANNVAIAICDFAIDDVGDNLAAEAVPPTEV